MSIETKQDKLCATAINCIYELCSYIRSHDDSYLPNLEQARRALEVIENLRRYSQTIHERISNEK